MGSDMKAVPVSGPDVHIRMTKEVIDDELFISLEDVPRGLKATLVFHRFPGYLIDNETDEIVEMKTYSPTAFVYIWPAMKRRLTKGRNWVFASGVDVVEEQAVFKMSNGKTYVVLLAADYRAPAFVTLHVDL